MKPIYLLLIAFLYIGDFFSQQLPISSHNLLNKQLFNPSFIASDNTSNFQTSYRAQWVGFNGSPRTFFIGGQTPINYGKFGVGGYFYNDFAGNSITHTGILLPLSFSKEVQDNSYLSFGLSPVLEQYSMDLSNQNPLVQNDPSIIQSQSIAYIADLNIGVSYRKDSTLSIGIGVQQLLESKIKSGQSLISDSNRFVRHFNLYASYLLYSKNNFSITPMLLCKSIFVTPFQFDIGAMVAIDRFKIGAYYRSSDAIYAQLGFSLNELNIFYSYDFTLSDIRKYSTGSHEITLQYKIKQKLDTDKDGVPDEKDQCKEEPGPKENSGCPWGDKDGDGVTDNLDKCPEISGPSENSGCPWGDKDGDGVTDNIDKCPDVSGPKENKGCPWLDSDGDGVHDGLDKCKDLAGPIENNGCPWGDKDGDGVTDNLDQCPNTKGSSENNGCPIVNDVIKQQITRAVDNLEFETNSDKIIPSSLPALDVLSILLLEKSDWNIKLSGHTDNVGDDMFNYDLSRRRSEAVKQYLISKGVQSERISTEHFGEMMPIDTNDTPEGRKKNRRVEMKLIFN